jgi:outer membrane immunogenic protein
MSFKSIKSLLAAATILGGAAAAQAADIPIRPPVYKGAPRSVIAYYNWTGFYVGLNAGYAFGSSSWDNPPVTVKPTGYLIGGTAGYNWQSGALVYGLEGDLAWAMVDGSTTCGAGTCEIEHRWLSTLRGRIGYAFDRFMVYGTAGGAYGNVRATNTAATPGMSGANATELGWTAGAGLEYAFLGNWTAKLEYLYVDLGSFNCVACAVGGAATNNVTFTENLVRAGINYKFAGPIFSRY